jgi:putative flippase GtrA
MTDKRMNENTEHAVKFFFFSISAGVIQALSFTFFDQVTKFEYKYAYLIALALSVLWNFTLNRKFTFKSAANVPVAMTKVAVFYAIFTPLSTWWGDSLTEIGWHSYIVLFGTMIINLVTEFLYTKYFVYHNQINTALDKVESETE